MIQQLLCQFFLLKLFLVSNHSFKRLFGCIPVACAIQRHREVVEDAGIAAGTARSLAEQGRTVFGVPLVVRIQPNVSAV